MIETFKEKLFLLLLDKFLIALIIVIAGFLFSKMLEQYKSKQSLFNEIAKKEIEKISDCWQLAYESETIIMHMVRRASEIQIEAQNDFAKKEKLLVKDIAPLNELSIKKSGEFQEIVEKNRLWISNNLYNNFREFHNHLMTYLNAFAESDFEKLKISEKGIENLKQNINQIVNNVNTKR